MGNIIHCRRKKQNAEEIKPIMPAIDSEKVVQKAEFLRTELANIWERMNTMADVSSNLASKQIEIHDLKKQIDVLIHINAELEQKIYNLTHPVMSEDGTRSTSDSPTLQTGDIAHVSRMSIEKIVIEMLKNEDLNIKYFPDWVEKKIYTNVFTMMMNLVNEILKTTQLQCIGHEVSVSMNPIQVRQSSDKNIGETCETIVSI